LYCPEVAGRLQLFPPSYHSNHEESPTFHQLSGKRVEQALGQTLVEAQVGGAGVRRSSLTPLARELVAATLHLRSGRFRLVDVLSTLELPYRADGGRLWRGGVAAKNCGP
jgi:hypothetical protein